MHTEIWYITAPRKHIYVETDTPKHTTLIILLIGIHFMYGRLKHKTIVIVFLRSLWHLSSRHLANCLYMVITLQNCCFWRYIQSTRFSPRLSKAVVAVSKPQSVDKLCYPFLNQYHNDIMK